MDDKPTNGRDRATLWIGAAVLGGFAVLVVYMFSLLASSETTWSRALYLFAGVEAMAFAAAGYLFGREVNRQRAESAERRASQAEQQLRQWSERALEAEAKGQSLSTAARVMAEQHHELAPLAQMAQALFPEKP
ncbi:hypothetical protein [Meiothermus hypogaeus]|uniref:Uncharacterized protein n=2 Tax=Meiothermus hypogaeus TaxID=884155 RepID=A0A511R344_9DEIN|nr:hypothetical protein [Meiothermus hypogaeus]RIH74912.1 hypothetical protein Mhypo_03131 [Meiothermus hypogaeus]GEM84005.1 hypothetical protein MHY01S_21710 [Meiothermus hypogaeus NBRC 106114]GIW36738.1 MAG: hypothetical protein KatS3mg073_0883 [Meiothermus sp.]